MDNRKFEQLIDMIINENEEQARALFHDIVVEKSREIYESMMDEEFGGEHSQVGALSDEIGHEEEGMTEEEDEFADIDDGEGEEVSLDGDEFGGEEGEEGLEDRVVDLEDKLDELMAEFEELMGSEGGEAGDEFGGEKGGEEGFGDEGQEGAGEEEFMESDDEEEEESLEESVQLQKVPVAKMGDNGTNTKSIVSNGPKVGGNGAKAVNFTGEAGKGGTQGGLLNPASKDLKGAGTFKNAPGGKKVDLEAAPKAKHGDNGQNTKSIVGESRKTVKRIVK